MEQLNPEKLEEKKVAVLETASACSGQIAWKSKTLWASAIAAILPLAFPPAGIWIAANPEIYSAVLGALFGCLRVVSKEKIVIK